MPYFSSVFTVEDCNFIPDASVVFDRNILEGLSEIEITADMIEKKLSKLNKNKCPALDGIHPKLLFELRGIIAEPLSKL